MRPSRPPADAGLIIFSKSVSCFTLPRAPRALAYPDIDGEGQSNGAVSMALQDLIGCLAAAFIATVAAGAIVPVRALVVRRKRAFARASRVADRGSIR